MTTDLDKQFFETFGIEPKLNRPCEQLLQNKYCNENSGSRDTYFDPYPYCVGFENCTKDYKERVWVYPKITDRILLELICLLNTITHPDLGDVYVEKLKTTVLQEYLKMFDSDFWENEEKSKKEFIEEVQALFKE